MKKLLATLTVLGVCISNPNAAIITGGGSVSDGTVTPSKISTTATDDFTFPRDIIVTRDAQVTRRIYPPAVAANYIDINHPGIQIVHATQDDNGLQIDMTHPSATGVGLRINDNTGTGNFVVFPTGNMLTNGYMQFASKTISSFGSTTPGAVAQAYYCSDCTKTVLCISTGTARGAFADASQTVLGARQFCN